MNLTTVHKTGVYIIVTLTGMVVAALAAYYILVEFVYPIKGPDIIPRESFSGIAQARGVILSIEHDSQSIATTTKVTIDTNSGEPMQVLIPININLDCVAINVVDPAGLMVGDTIDVKGADIGNGVIFPCAEVEHHLVKVGSAQPVVVEEISVASSTASTTQEDLGIQAETVESN